MTQGKNKDSNDFAGDDLIRGAYAIENQDDAQAFYRLWADDYDDHMVEKLGYVSPTIVAEQLLTHSGTPEGAFLDIGCGTGLTGQALADRGVATLDGIDLSQAMIDRAAARGIYRKLSLADLTRPLALPGGSYDAMVSSGTFTHGHVGPEPLGGLMSLVRRGGHFAFTVHQDIWTGHGFEAEVARLQQAGILDVVERRLDRFFAPLDPVGWFVVARRP
jgi:predicted TPR repeat methyltransferase